MSRHTTTASLGSRRSTKPSTSASCALPKAASTRRASVCTSYVSVFFLSGSKRSTCQASAACGTPARAPLLAPLTSMNQNGGGGACGAHILCAAAATTANVGRDVALGLARERRALPGAHELEGWQDAQHDCGALGVRVRQVKVLCVAHEHVPVELGARGGRWWRGAVGWEPDERL
eukprot:6088359-Prymnesium_polylepis.2